MSDCQMYTMTRDGKPIAYRYGEDWVAMMLFCEGGYSTPEEAKEAWEDYLETGSFPARK